MTAPTGCALVPAERLSAARTRRIACLLFTVWVLCMADLSFTLWAHWFTPFYELNPIARTLLSHNWLTSLVLMKLLLTGGGTGIFWLFRRRRTAEVATWVVVVAYVLLACQWSNYTQAAMIDLAKDM